MRRADLRVVVAIAVAASALGGGCEGSIDTSGGTPHVDLDAAVRADAASSGDAGTATGSDSGGGMAVDAYVPPVDAYAPRDAGPPDPTTCDLGPPLSDPIAGCRPTPLASTGDPHEDCVRRINQFRCECQHLPPLARWTEGEACADMMAEYDHEHPGEAHAAFRAGICSPRGSGQNECPGWPSVDATISGCLQQMWDEGPGDFYGPPPHGHYINMSSTSFSRVACGFYQGTRGVYALQNFQ